MKPRIFVGSSSEGREIANALHANLQDVAEVTVWDQDIFRPSEYFLEALLRALESVDFGVFVFSQDDEVVMRGTRSSTVRDNVVFELGLFVGRLGRKRSIFVKPRGVEMRIPSDLQGVTAAEFEPDRQDKNWRAALGPAARSIREVIKDFQSSSLPPRSAFTDNDMKLLASAGDPHYPSQTAAYAFGCEPLQWDDRLCMRYIRFAQLGLLQVCGDTEIELSEKGRAFVAQHVT